MLWQANSVEKKLKKVRKREKMRKREKEAKLALAMSINNRGQQALSKRRDPLGPDERERENKKKVNN